MSEQPTEKRAPVRTNTINTRVEERLFKKVYAISREYNTTMSDVTRLCITLSIDQVEEILKKTNTLRFGVKPN